ncbi:MAG: hypothetical protein MAG453_01043 [Calditrichaeota bacterium]|nr:hypothetical protein [Calditrichota bacterium]
MTGGVEKRRQVFAAAEPLFERYGYRKTTVEDVCCHARMSKRTFYELFADKFDLLTQLLAQLSEDLVTAFRREISPDTDPVVQLRLYFRHFFAHTELRPVFRILLEEGDLMKRVTRAAPGNLQFGSVLRLLAEIIERGVRAGRFRPVDTDTVTWIIQALLDSIHLFPLNSAAAGGALPPQRLIDETTEFIVHGLLAWQGRT